MESLLTKLVDLVLSGDLAVPLSALLLFGLYKAHAIAQFVEWVSSREVKRLDESLSGKHLTEATRAILTDQFNKLELKRFTGINAFGIRLRHACFDRWLRENRSIDYVMEHLAEANFDPEFSPRHEPEIAARFLQSASTISER